MGGETKEKVNDYWSNCGQIYFTGGYGYGISVNLQTVVLGKESDILKALEDGSITHDLKDIEKATLEQIIDYRKERGYGNTEPGMVGVIPHGTSGSKQKTIRRSTARERLAIRSSKSKGKGLFRR